LLGDLITVTFTRFGRGLAPVAFVVCLSVAAPLRADVSVDLSSIVNSDLSTYTNGTNYPGPGPITIGGIDFNLAAFPNTSDTGVVGGGASIGVPQNYSITGLNISGVTAMYAIINSAFGTCGTTVGSIGATTSGSSSTTTLMEGQNVRDHFNGVFCNTETDSVATAGYTGDIRFDVYKFDLTGLTGGGATPITGLDFSTFGAAGNGEPFLAAVTFSTATVPEPAAWPLLALGGVALLGLRRRRKIEASNLQ
jgi:hypothetical protein